MTDNTTPQNPRVFISYSWDSPEHKAWVESFARELRKDGIDARIDAWRDESQSIDDFMMLELEKADFVIAICTPQYKQKIIENAEGEVKTASGFEMGTAAALRRAGGKDVIPVLRTGAWTEAAPSSLISYRFYDFTGGDVSAEFEQLRDRLLGHVRRPPELGQPKAPTSGPDLPDIFEGEGHPAPPTETMPPSADRPRSAPSSADSVPPAPSPSVKKGSKGWLWALGGAIGVIVLLMLIPTGDEGVDPGPPASPMGLQDGGAILEAGAEESADLGGGAFGQLSGPADDGAADSGAADVGSGEQPQIDVAAGWVSASDDSVCVQLTRLAANRWLLIGYDASVDLYLMDVYDPNWDELPVGQSDRVVTELDEDPLTVQTWSVEGIIDETDGSRGIRIQFVNDTFFNVLTLNKLLSFYWDDDPYRDYWVMDADLRGIEAAYRALAGCAAGFGK